MELPEKDHLSLSLHVVDNTEVEDPVPLNTIYASNSISVSKSWNPKNCNLDENHVDPGSSPGKITMQLRRSPRLSPLVHSVDSGSNLSRKRKANAALGRRSRSGVVELGLIELPVRKDMDDLVVSNGRVLRSGKVAVSTALIEFRKPKGTPVRKVRDALVLDVGSSGGKVLRSGKVAASTPVLRKNKETETAMIELPDKEERKRILVNANGISGEHPIKDNRPKAGKAEAIDSSSNKAKKQKAVAFFVGEPIPDVEAREKWNWRYELKVIV